MVSKNQSHSHRLIKVKKVSPATSAKAAVIVKIVSIALAARLALRKAKIIIGERIAAVGQWVFHHHHPQLNSYSTSLNMSVKVNQVYIAAIAIAIAVAVAVH